MEYKNQKVKVNIEKEFDTKGLNPSQRVTRYKYKNLKSETRELKADVRFGYDVSGSTINVASIIYKLKKGALKDIYFDSRFLLTYDAATNLELNTVIDHVIFTHIPSSKQFTFYWQDMIKWQYQMTDRDNQLIAEDNNVIKTSYNPAATETIKQVLKCPFGSNLAFNPDGDWFFDILPIRTKNDWEMEVFFKTNLSSFAVLTTSGTDTIIPNYFKVYTTYEKMDKIGFNQLLAKYDNEPFTLYNTTIKVESDTPASTTLDEVEVKINKTGNYVAFFLDTYVKTTINSIFAPVGDFSTMSGIYNSTTLIRELTYENSEIAKTVLKNNLRYLIKDTNSYVFQPNYTSFYNIEEAGCYFDDTSDLQLTLNNVTGLTNAKHFFRVCALRIEQIKI